MSNRLAQICSVKREEVARGKTLASLVELEARAAKRSPPRGFRAALEAASREGYGLVAEIKRASPSKGLIRADFDPLAHACAYAAGGAACISVLTDELFQGRDEHLIAARDATCLPVLRKDFIVDPWQVAEARAIGADAILIIVAALDDGAMREIEDAANAHGMDVLVEVHDEAELDRALRLRSRLIGVNNRDLRDFSVDLGRSEAIAALTPGDCTLVAESGLATRADLDRLAARGIRCFLVGEALMRQDDLEAATRSLLAGE